MTTLDRLAALASGSTCSDCGRRGRVWCDACSESAPRPTSSQPPAGVDRVLAAWAYEGTARSLVLDLKLRGVRTAAVPLGRGVARMVLDEGVRSNVLVWVPGRVAENRIRGFDHAELIARAVADRIGLPVAPILFRRGGTADQAGLSRAQRRSNLIGAFGARAIEGWVGVVDDVVTTGATAEACARALKSAGAAGVEVLSACRA